MSTTRDRDPCDRGVRDPGLMGVAVPPDDGVATIEFLGMLPFVLLCCLAVVQVTGVVNASLRAEHVARNAAVAQVGPGHGTGDGQVSRVSEAAIAARSLDVVVVRRSGNRVVAEVRVPLVLPLPGGSAVRVTGDAKIDRGTPR